MTQTTWSSVSTLLDVFFVSFLSEYISATLNWYTMITDQMENLNVDKKKHETQIFMEQFNPELEKVGNAVCGPNHSS